VYLKVTTALISTSININVQCTGNIVTYRHTQYYTFHYPSPSILKIKVNLADNILSFCILKKKDINELCTFLGDTLPHFFKDSYNVTRFALTSLVRASAMFLLRTMENHEIREYNGLCWHIVHTKFHEEQVNVPKRKWVRSRHKTLWWYHKTIFFL